MSGLKPAWEEAEIMGDCEFYGELLSAYLDGELEAGEASELEAHLAECRDCSRRLDDYLALSAAAFGEAEPPAGFAEHVMAHVRTTPQTKKHSPYKKYRSMAAAIALIVCGAVGLAVGSAKLSTAKGGDNASPYDSDLVLTEHRDTLPESANIIDNAVEGELVLADSDSVPGGVQPEEYAATVCVTDISLVYDSVPDARETPLGALIPAGELDFFLQSYAGEIVSTDPGVPDAGYALIIETR